MENGKLEVLKGVDYKAIDQVFSSFGDIFNTVLKIITLPLWLKSAQHSLILWAEFIDPSILHAGQ